MVNLPANILLAKLFAAKELAAYIGYASTKKVKMPLKQRIFLQHSKRLATWEYIGQTAHAYIAHASCELKHSLDAHWNISSGG